METQLAASAATRTSSPAKGMMMKRRASAEELGGSDGYPSAKRLLETSSSSSSSNGRNIATGNSSNNGNPNSSSASVTTAGGTHGISKRREELFHEANERSGDCSNSTSADKQATGGLSLSTATTGSTGQGREEVEHLLKVLRGHFLFTGMSDADVQRIVNAMQKISVKAGEVIIEEGGVGDFFYVVDSGSLEVTQNNAPGVVDVLTRDRVFGELALIYDCPRAATIRAKENSVLWSLSSVVFRELATRFTNENLQRRVEKLRRIPVFEKLSDDQLRRVSAVMQEERFAPGTLICSQGEVLVPGVNDKFYTIAEGMVAVTAAGLPRRASRGIMIDPSNKLGQRRASPLSPATSVMGTAGNIARAGSLVGAGRTSSGSSAGMPLAAPPTPSGVILATPMTPLGTPGPSGSPIPNSVMSTTDFDLQGRGQLRMPRRTSSESFLEDNASLARSVALGNLGPGEWFGEIALMSDAPRSANVIALGNLAGSSSSKATVCYTLSRGAFEQIISPSPAQVAISGFSEARKADNHEKKMRHQREDTAASLSLENLDIGQVIGEGGFSVVRICTDRKTGEVFALKTMNKRDLFNRKQVVHVNNEVRILKEMSHPFILSLLKTFQDKRRLYMVLEFMPGGELFSRVLKSGGGLALDHAQFYAACVIEGLDYLHRKRIAYRDLKLENLVIGTDGYVKIIDFGFAKQLQEGEMTRTLCGTPDYLAPEAVTRMGHNHAVDCWGFGVLLYEMLTQYSPFADATCSGNRVIVFQNIMKGVRHVDWSELARPFRNALERLSAKGNLDPNTIVKINEQFDEVQDLLFRVWDANPLTRATAKTIKSHKYFASWDFAKLRELAIQAPWLPEVAGLSDLKYFDVESFKNVKECELDFEGPADMFAEFGQDDDPSDG